ncbi:hypothetical protein BC829DRAFT_408213 [Chytridium lagenaria]|nr:hypothetical protein BC829DRAFT_408213 [Chytridium lagenaria]
MVNIHSWASFALILLSTSSTIQAKKCKPKITTSVAGPAAFPTASPLPAPKPYGVIARPAPVEPSEDGPYNVPPAVEKVNPARIIAGKEKSPEGCKPQDVPIDPFCFTNVTYVYKYSSRIILAGGNGGDHTTNVTADASVTCLGSEDGKKNGTTAAHLYDLQITNLVITTQANTAADDGYHATEAANVTVIPDTDVSKPYRFIKSTEGQVLGCKVAETESDDIAAIKKGITESFSTYLKYTTGQAKVAETGVSSELNYLNHTAIEAKYDGSQVQRYAPGSHVKENAQYTAHTNAVVDANGILQSSYDRTHVLPGDESGYTTDETNGPDMRVHAASDCILVAQKPRIAIPEGENLKDEALLGKINAGASTLTRRSTAEDTEQVNALFRTLIKDPTNEDATRQLMLLSQRSTEAATLVLMQARRQLSSTSGSISLVARRSRDARTHAHVPPHAILSALAASSIEDAHMHIVDIVGDATNDIQGLARAVLTFAKNPSEDVVNRVSNMTTPGHANVVVLGSLLSSRPASHASILMTPHIDAAIANIEDDRQSMNVMLGVGNMGKNALTAVDAMITVAADVRRSMRVRVEAVKALRDVMDVTMVRNELATLLSNISPFDIDLKVAIIEVATAAVRQTRSLRTAPADSLDMSILAAAVDETHKTYSPDVASAVEEYLLLRTGGSASVILPTNHLTRRAGDSWKLLSDTQWNSTKSRTFDLVQPLGERQQDNLDFPTNGAGLAGIYLGWDKLNLQVAGGAFGGLGKQGCIVPEFKAYSRARASFSAFGRVVEVLDAKLHVIHRITPPLASAGASLVLMNKSILSEDLTFTCKTWVFPITNLPFTILDFSYEIPIYIASISVGVNLSGNFRAQVDLTVCAEPSATVQFKPTISAVLTGTGSLSYTLGPEIRALVPSDGCKVCISLNQGWDPANIKIAASVDYRFFIGKWRNAKNWDLFSYNFAGQPFTPIPGLTYCADPAEIFKKKPKKELPEKAVTEETKPKSTTTIAVPATTHKATTTTSTITTLTTKTVLTSTTTTTTTDGPVYTATTTTTIIIPTTTTTTEEPVYTAPPPSLTTTTAIYTTTTTTTSTTTTTEAAPVYGPPTEALPVYGGGYYGSY